MVGVQGVAGSIREGGSFPTFRLSAVTPANWSQTLVLQGVDQRRRRRCLGLTAAATAPPDKSDRWLGWEARSSNTARQRPCGVVAGYIKRRACPPTRCGRALCRESEQLVNRRRIVARATGYLEWSDRSERHWHR